MIAERATAAQFVGVPAADMAAIESTERAASPMPPAAAPGAGLPRVVIVGAGFGGLAAATALRRANVQLTVIDRRNYHLFQPLLYQVATAGLSPADIAQPIRSILRRQRNTRVLLGRVTDVDLAAREVLIARARPEDRAPRAVRFPGRRHRRAPCLFRPRRVGAVRARAQEDRGRDRHPPAHPARVRAGRDRRGRGRAPAPAQLRDRRRRPDRGRDGGRDRRAVETRARGRFPQRRSAPGAGAADPVRAAPAAGVLRNACRPSRSARSSGSASRSASARRSRSAMPTASRSARSASRPAPCCGPPASPPRPRRAG